ncbi:unnamed protein product [Vitrella brassicaformis CCMP3155]|uniref:RecA family profile 1 domain-containing protein n=1 Tax=Vitrella brassicaformis (strain CCMP3155) TaxID=1169540 RepID=A0A0G4GMR7_VITBC|nr:unnamed protein product [Vitrella brassicaformis CCMP3155]|eukprot:CEM31425.1 unnamed protein product [Vitrella brassicaformis CCMP3155]
MGSEDGSDRPAGFRLIHRSGRPPARQQSPASKRLSVEELSRVFGHLHPWELTRLRPAISSSLVRTSAGLYSHLALDCSNDETAPFWVTMPLKLAHRWGERAVNLRTITLRQPRNMNLWCNVTIETLVEGHARGRAAMIDRERRRASEEGGLAQQPVQTQPEGSLEHIIFDTDPGMSWCDALERGIQSCALCHDPPGAPASPVTGICRDLPMTEEGGGESAAASLSLSRDALAPTTLHGLKSVKGVKGIDDLSWGRSTSLSYRRWQMPQLHEVELLHDPWRESGFLWSSRCLRKITAEGGMWASSFREAKDGTLAHLEGVVGICLPDKPADVLQLKADLVRGGCRSLKRLQFRKQPPRPDEPDDFNFYTAIPVLREIDNLRSQLPHCKVMAPGADIDLDVPAARHVAFLCPPHDISLPAPDTLPASVKTMARQLAGAIQTVAWDPGWSEEHNNAAPTAQHVTGDPAAWRATRVHSFPNAKQLCIDSRDDYSPADHPPDHPVWSSLHLLPDLPSKHEAEGRGALLEEVEVRMCYETDGIRLGEVAERILAIQGLKITISHLSAAPASADVPVCHCTMATLASSLRVRGLQRLQIIAEWLDPEAAEELVAELSVQDGTMPGFSVEWQQSDQPRNKQHRQVTVTAERLAAAAARPSSAIPPQAATPPLFPTHSHAAAATAHGGLDKLDHSASAAAYQPDGAAAASSGGMVKLTTGCAAFDNLTDGGIETGVLTEVFGEFGSGVGVLCHTLAVTAQLPVDQGGAEGKKVAWIALGPHPILPGLIRKIAERFGLDAKQVLKNISYARPLNSDHRTKLLVKLASMMREARFALLIVDSAISRFQLENSGYCQLAGQLRLCQFLRKLQKMAKELKVAVVVTNQVEAAVDPLMSALGGEDTKPLAGHIMAHASHRRLHLRKGKGQSRVATIYDSPSMADKVEAHFAITEAGIAGRRDHGQGQGQGTT